MRYTLRSALCAIYMLYALRPILCALRPAPCALRHSTTYRGKYYNSISVVVPPNIPCAIPRALCPAPCAQHLNYHTHHNQTMLNISLLSLHFFGACSVIEQPLRCVICAIQYALSYTAYTILYFPPLIIGNVGQYILWCYPPPTARKALLALILIALCARQRRRI